MAIAIRYMTNEADAADILSHAFVKMFKSLQTFDGTKGNFHGWLKKIIINDFEEMRKAGINTVKIYGPNIYDHSTFDAAEQKKLKIHYSFWMPAPPSYMNDTSHLKEQSLIILETINKHKLNHNISAWNLSNSSYQQLAQFYYGPQLQEAQQHYINFLKSLVKEIKLADPSRPLTVDLLSSPTLGITIRLLHEQIPEIDAFGLIISSKQGLKFIKPDFSARYFFSSADPDALEAAQPSGGIFYANWQDQQSGTAITLDGLKDIWGRNKPYLYKISRNWHGSIANHNLPHIKILKPALTTTPGASLPYNALVYLSNKWDIAAYSKTELKFEWYFVKTDSWGNAIDMKKLGNGPKVYVTIPQNNHRYRVYLVAVKGNNETEDYTTLNTPLQN